MNNKHNESAAGQDADNNDIEAYEAEEAVQEAEETVNEEAEKIASHEASEASDLSAALGQAITDAIAKAKAGKIQEQIHAPQQEKPSDSKILNDTKIDPTDKDGNPIPVTIPVALTPNIMVVYTTRLGGVSEDDFANFNLGGKGGDDPEHVRRNREALAKELDAKLSLIRQVHSGDAIDIDEVYKDNSTFGFDASGTVDAMLGATYNPQLSTVDDVEHVDGKSKDAVQIIDGDAQVTTKKNVALGIFAADCLPVLLADEQAGVIAAAHCGRLGLQKGVIRATVQEMLRKGASTTNIVATLGPAICGDCYEVGRDIADEFDAQFPGTFTLTRFGGPGVDLNKAAIMELKAVGVLEDHIVSSRPRVNAATQYLSQDAELAQLCAEDNEGDPDLNERIGAIRHSMCTLENPLWFSHRRAQLAHKEHEGRMLALIVRR